MAANDDATVTIDTNEMTYTDRHETTHVVDNGQTFVMALAAVGSTTRYDVKQDTLTFTDGSRVEISIDDKFSSFVVDADATAKPDAGSIWFREDDGYQAEWKLRTITIDNIDEPTEISTATFERVDNPQITMVWTTITVAQ